MDLVIDGLKINLEALIDGLKRVGNMQEKLRAAQMNRSRRYGIEVLPKNSALTIPARFVRMGAQEADFADPVNYKYPVWLTKQGREDLSPAQLGQVRNAMVRFSTFREAYSATSQGKVEERINKARRKFGVGDFAKTSEIIKADEVLQVVYGVALRPDKFDSQGHRVSEREIVRTAHEWMIESRRGDLMHERPLKASEFRVVESMIARVDEPPNVVKGDWVVGVKLGDELWGKVLSGELNGFSIKGRGIHVPVAE